MISSNLLLADDDILYLAQEEMNDIHRTYDCCEDVAFTSISTSMIGWGFALAAGIALLTGLLHQSKKKSTTSTSTDTQ